MKVEILASTELQLPSDPQILVTLALEDDLLKVRGRVVFMKEDSERHGILGIEFLDLPPEEREMLSKFLMGKGG